MAIAFRVFRSVRDRAGSAPRVAATTAALSLLGANAAGAQSTVGRSCSQQICVSLSLGQVSKSNLEATNPVETTRTYRLTEPAAIEIRMLVNGLKACYDPRVTITSSKAGVVDAAGRPKIETIAANLPYPLTANATRPEVADGWKMFPVKFAAGLTGEYAYAAEFSCQMPAQAQRLKINTYTLVRVDIPFAAPTKARDGLAIPIKPRAPIPPLD